jgi:DNA-directed RNA polymerase sigma subunit (sigma70/sigma32)
MSGDPLDMYLREVEEYPPIADDEAIELGRALKAGGPSETTLQKQLIQPNLRLVVTIARFYEDLGVPLLDLIQEGNRAHASGRSVGSG